jgi:hypothetical protein
MSTLRTMSREIGTALAVLAIYLLTVLAPIHEARASQLAFEELGYASLQTSWSLCTPADPDRHGGGEEGTPAKCPAAGVGKSEFTPLAQAMPAGHDPVPLASPLAAAAPDFIPARTTPPGGSRAPPRLS